MQIKQAKKRIKRLSQFLSAALRAVWAMLTANRSVLAGFKMIVRVGREAFRVVSGEEVPRKLAYQRLRHCAKQCPLYDAKRKTCGRIGETFKGEDGFKTLGCWCFLPLKVRYRCSCWWYERSEGAYGWPKELND